MTARDLQTRPRFWLAKEGEEIVAAGIMHTYDEPLMDLDRFGLLDKFDLGLIQIEVGREVPRGSRWAT